MKTLIGSLAQTGANDSAVTKKIKIDSRKGTVGIVISRVEFELDPTIVVNWNETIDQWLSVTLSRGYDGSTTPKRFDNENVICSWLVAVKAATQVGFNYPPIQFDWIDWMESTGVNAVDELQLTLDSVSQQILNKVYYRITYYEVTLDEIEFVSKKAGQ